MKRFRFRLEILLRLQRLRQRLAEQEQAQAYQRWSAMREQLQALQAHAQEISHSASSRLSSAPSSDAIAAEHYWFLLAEHLVVLGHIVKLAHQQEQLHRQAWQQSDQRRLEITRKVEALNWLREQAWQAFRRQQRLVEQHEMDELVLRSWSRQTETMTVHLTVSLPELLSAGNASNRPVEASLAVSGRIQTEGESARRSQPHIPDR